MTKQAPNSSGQAPVMGRFIGGVFGLVFLGIGVSVIIFLWGSPFDEFHSPPLFFRVVGSLIALAFVAVGGSVAFAAIKGVRPGLRPPVGFGRTGQQHSDNAAYERPRCSAPLSAQADVSPHGDVKCTHCDSWFNIHT